MTGTMYHRAVVTPRLTDLVPDKRFPLPATVRAITVTSPHMTGCKEAMVDYVQTNVISGVWVFMAMFIIEVGTSTCTALLTIAPVYNLGE